MDKITEIIVFGKLNDRSFLTKRFQNTCTDEELKHLYATLDGWTNLAIYDKPFKGRIKKGMRNIKEIQKKRERKNKY